MSHICGLLVEYGVIGKETGLLVRKPYAVPPTVTPNQALSVTILQPPRYFSDVVRVDKLLQCAILTTADTDNPDNRRFTTMTDFFLGILIGASLGLLIVWWSEANLQP